MKLIANEELETDARIIDSYSPPGLDSGEYLKQNLKTKGFVAEFFNNYYRWKAKNESGEASQFYHIASYFWLVESKNSQREIDKKQENVPNS